MDIARTLTQPQGMVGTLPYMSPEQLRGEGADSRSDIWAAGAVLYEMATGQRAFPEANSALLCNAILMKDPEPPSSLNPKISPGLENVILKALAKEPGHRYQTARELGVDLDRITAGITPVARIERTRKFPFVWAGLAAIVLVSAAGGYFYAHKRAASVQSTNGSAGVNSGGLKQRRAVAVLGFKNLAGKPELAWLSTALSEMLTTELAAGEQLRTIPGESVAQMKVSLAPPETDSYSKETLGKIRSSLGTDDVVLGSFVPLGEGEIRVDVRMQDAAGGETIVTVSERGSVAHLDELVYRAGAKLRGKLGVADVSEVESEAVKASMPSDQEAARYYAEGLGKIRVYDYLGARGYLQKAIGLEPNFAPAHIALATAWGNLGYGKKAQEEAKKAFELSESLRREDRLSIEGRYRETTHEWAKATEIYKTLVGFFPDNLEYGLLLADTQSSAGTGQEAMATVEQLRGFPAPLRDDPRIDLAEAGAARAMSDYRRVKAAAEKGAKKGQTEGALLIVARARNYECMALRNMGDAKGAIAPCENAQTIYATAGDQGGVALLQNNLANIYYDLGNLAGAEKNYRAALTTYQLIGNQSGAAGAMDNLANVLSDLGDRAGARKLSLQALKVYQDVGDQRGEADTLNNIGAQHVAEGNFAEAERIYEQAVNILRQTGDMDASGVALNNIGEMLLDQGRLAESKQKYEEAYKSFHDSGQKGKSGYPLFGLAQILYAQGDLAGAEEKYKEVLAIAREADDKHNAAYALFGQGQILALRDDLSGAQKLQEEALAIRTEIGETATVAESSLELASIALEENRLGDAEKLGKTAREEFRAEKLKESEVLARVVLARIYLASNKVGDARKEIDQAGGMAAKSGFVGVRLSYAIESARVKAATGKMADGLKAAEAALVEAEKWGYREFVLEARLALGEMELKSGREAEGRKRLESLAKDARGSRFLTVARKAEKAGGR